MDDVKAIFQRKQAEDRRLVLLRFLHEDTDYTLNTSLLQDALHAVGHSVSRNVIDHTCAWLEEAGLVTVSSVGAVTLVKLTQHGAEVATGLCVVPGVKRPAPR